jgi:hypothetical protein
VAAWGLARMAPYFSRKLIKAIDGWQAGSVGKRGKALAIRNILFAEPAVDQWCKQCDVVCYRRTKIVGPAIKTLFFKFYVEEETSSWTTQPQMAPKFKVDRPSRQSPAQFSSIYHEQRRWYSTWSVYISTISFGPQLSIWRLKV